MHSRMMTIVLIVIGIVFLGVIVSCSREQPADEADRTPQIPIDVMPKVLDAKVSYPEEARLRGEEGIVMVKALVGTDGRVTEAAVDTTRPASPALSRAAVEAVRGWRFEPARSKGDPVEVWIVVPVNFRLQ